MRVRVYKAADNTLSAFVEPSPGKGRPPVLLMGVTPSNVVDMVLPVITALRRPREKRTTGPRP